MKRLYFAAAAFLLLTIGCIACTIVVSRCADRMEGYLRCAQGYASAGDFAGAADAAGEASAWWETWEPVLDAVRQHSETDQIGLDLGKLLVYAETEDLGEFSAVCSELLRQVRHIQKMEYPFLQNIL